MREALAPGCPRFQASFQPFSSTEGSGLQSRDDMATALASKYCRLCGLCRLVDYSFCHNYSVLPLCHKISHRHDMSKYDHSSVRIKHFTFKNKQWFAHQSLPGLATDESLSCQPNVLFTSNSTLYLNKLEAVITTQHNVIYGNSEWYFQLSL